MAKVGRNDACPCGSGNKFKKCCLGKPFSWETDDSGEAIQAFPVEGRLEELLNEMDEEFKRHFERPPRGNDALFLAKHYYSEDDVKRKTIEAMEKTGMDPAFIYAYRKTGYLLTETSKDRATGAAIKEWNDAVDEFDAHGDDPARGTEGFQFDSLLADIVLDFESLIYLFGLANDSFLSTPVLPSPRVPDAVMSAAQYQALCVVRTHRTLRSIRTLLDEHMADDVLKLTRAIYENYLHMVFVAEHPEKVKDLVDAVIGLRAGTHTYKMSSAGRPDKRTIVEPSTGAEYSGHISAFRMAEASHVADDLEFFDFFYQRTSEFLHPSVFALDGYVSEHGLDPVKPHAYEEGVIFSALVACMVAERISYIEGCPETTKTDVRVVVSRTRSKLLEALKHLDVWQKRIGANQREISLLLQRCESLLQANSRLQPTPRGGAAEPGR